jgi:hypothetical protein
MAKTVNDAHLSLAYRLGATSVPSSSTEKAKRLQWFVEAINNAISDQNFWFMKDKHFDTTVADQSDYSYPTDLKSIIQIKVDDYKYESVIDEEVYRKFEMPSSPVPILPAYMARSWFDMDNKFWLVPIPSAAPTSYTVGLVQSSGTATATSTTAHGFSRGYNVTIAGADQTEYNGSFEILTVPSTTTFTFSVDSTATSPATGTITAVRKNIEVWYYKKPTEPTSDSSSIVLPDEYMGILVAYGEGRYWSAAHKRAKAADAFLEYETLIDKMKNENIRRKFQSNI